MPEKYFNIFGEYAERIYAYMEIKQEALGVFS
jgi:hypothetical protein